MTELSKNTYKFGDFSFDADKPALYYQNQLIKNTGGKSLHALSVLLQNANELAAHDEIIEQVWQDNPAGVTSDHVAQYISKLRKILAEYEPESKFIENVKGRGYMFVGSVASGAVAPKENESPEELLFLQTESLFTENIENNWKDAPPETDSSRRNFTKPVYLFAALFAVVIMSLVGWNWQNSKDDEQEIERVVKDSQKFESLVLYEHPDNFDEAQLAKYWLPNTGFNADYDINKVEEGVQRLINEERYYGRETKLELFEFQNVDINTSKDFAVVKTLEKWFIVEYRKDDTLLKTKNVGPYFVSYILRKVDGRWLIEKSTTARADSAQSR